MTMNRVKTTLLRGLVIAALALGIGSGFTLSASAESMEDPGIICTIEPLPDGGLSFTYHVDGGCDAAIDYYYGDGGSDDGGSDGGSEDDSWDDLGDWPFPGGCRYC